MCVDIPEGRGRGGQDCEEQPSPLGTTSLHVGCPDIYIICHGVSVSTSNLE